MNRRRITAILALSIFVTAVMVFVLNPQLSTVRAQIPTGSVPTVTGTPKGPTVSVKPDINEDFANVRSGPGVLYPKVGVLLLGQEAPAIGVSPGREWVLVVYPGASNGQGWVYAPYVNISTGASLPVVQPPPTPTLLYTPTIDPTMAAQFVVTSAPTRLPTFTAPPPLNIPTYAPVSAAAPASSVPMGLVIVILFSMGLIIGIFSLFQGR